MELVEDEIKININKGDILKLKQNKFMFKKGEEFGVEEVTNEGIQISSKFGFGFMSHDELENFDIIKKKEEWSEWEMCSDCYIGYSKYRVKEKEVEVRVYVKDKNYRGYARCMEEDKFDLEKGLKIALKRARIKMEEDELNDLIK